MSQTNKYNPPSRTEELGAQIAGAVAELQTDIGHLHDELVELHEFIETLEESLARIHKTTLDPTATLASIRQLISRPIGSVPHHLHLFPLMSLSHQLASAPNHQHHQFQPAPR